MSATKPVMLGTVPMLRRHRSATAVTCVSEIADVRGSLSVPESGGPDPAERPVGESKPTGLDICRIIDLPKVADPRGNLTFIEGERHVPFEIKRVYYLYDVPGGAERGGHAHKGLHQLIIAMSGSFDVVLNDGKQEKRFHLNRSYSGMYVCPMIWRELDNFSSGSVCMVLASNLYDVADYYRDYDEFVRALNL